MEKVIVKVLPQGTEITCEYGIRLIDILRGTDSAWDFPCGGHGTCGKCRLRVHGDNIPAPTTEEIAFLSDNELNAGIRLACFVRVTDNLVISALEREKEHRILESGQLPEIVLNPSIRKKYLYLGQENLPLQKSLEEFITGAYGAKINAASRLAMLQSVNRNHVNGCTVIIADEEIIGVEPGDTAARCFGVAVDIGTTTVVASLIDLLTGAELGTASALNAQKDFGLDVLTRIEYAGRGKDEQQQLQIAVTGCINLLIADLCKQYAVQQTEIYEVAIAANTTMVHLLLGINPVSIGAIPYKPVLRKGISINARDLGLQIAPFGLIYILPAVSGYIGGDITAGVIATRLYEDNGNSLLIDIGTNGEIVLQKGEDAIACSAPAGPALEGMNITCGMRAADGAIEEVRIEQEVKIQTIGNKRPVGVCGSGIIDMVAELLKVGVVEPSGRMTDAVKLIANGKENLAKYLHRVEGQKAFLLVDGKDCSAQQQAGIYVYAKDIRQVQLAKGAIWSGIIALLNEAKICVEEIDTVYIAGAFGAHARPESLAKLGIIAENWLDKIHFVGNTAKAGAMMCLLSRQEREKIERVAETVAHFELAMRPEYDVLFTQALKFC